MAVGDAARGRDQRVDPPRLLASSTQMPIARGDAPASAISDEERELIARGSALWICVDGARAIDRRP